MKVTSSYLRRLIAIELERALTEGRLLFEKEGDEPDAADELFDDEGGDEEPPEGDDGDAPAPKAATKASKDAASEEEPEAEEEPEEEEEAEEEEAEEEPPKPTGPTGFEFDEEINTAMAGFEKRALDVAAAKNEGRVLSMSRFLFEAEDEDDVVLDVATFADDTARLISNYDTLIDMEQAIYTKAVDFVADKYGDDAAEQLRDILSLRYDLEFDEQNDPEGDEEEFYAVGATGGGGGGAA